MFSFYHNVPHPFSVIPSQQFLCTGTIIIFIRFAGRRTRFVPPQLRCVTALLRLFPICFLRSSLELNLFDEGT